jgi:hypothetical protein
MKPGSEAIDWKLLGCKHVCIEEVLPQNVDFLLLEISNALDAAPIFTFNQTAEHYERLAAQHSKRISVQSIYDCKYAPSAINDDVWTAEHVHKIVPEGRFFVYRSDSCSEAEYYRYDIVVRVEPLKSGVSSKIDGSVRIFDRYKKHCELKYKVVRDRVLYFP